MSGDRVAELEAEVRRLRSLLTTLAVSNLSIINNIRAIVSTNKLSTSYVALGEDRDAFSELGRIFDDIYEGSFAHKDDG